MIIERLWRAAIAALAWAGAEASAQEAGAARPVYPTVIVETDDRFSRDPELTAFRQTAFTASESLVSLATGEHLDPGAMLPFLAARVEIFVGQTRGLSDSGFRSIGLHDAGSALEIVGRLSDRSASADPLVARRYGMRAIGERVGEPTVGSTSWLGGRICTASYGQIEWPEWIVLNEGLGRAFDRIEDWVIAVSVEKRGAALLVAGDWPARFQIVPVSPEQKRAGGWTGIVAPAGGTVHFRTTFGDDVSHFASYLNDHVCFERGEDGWKITAIAMRLD